MGELGGVSKCSCSLATVQSDVDEGGRGQTAALGKQLFYGLARSSARDRTHLILLKHLILLQRLHRVDLASVDFLDQSNLSKRPFSNHFDCTEIRESNPRSSQSEEAEFLSGDPGLRPRWDSL